MLTSVQTFFWPILYLLTRADGKIGINMHAPPASPKNEFLSLTKESRAMFFQDKDFIPNKSGKNINASLFGPMEEFEKLKKKAKF